MVLSNVSKFYPSQCLLNIIRILPNVTDRPSENTSSEWGWDYPGPMARASMIAFLNNLWATRCRYGRFDNYGRIGKNGQVWQDFLVPQVQ